MRLNRGAVAALAGAAALLVGGSVAFAAHNDGQDNQSRCQQRLAKVAEKRGVSVAQLESQIKERLLARIDAALQAGRISPERAAALKARIEGAELCSAAGHPLLRHGIRTMFKAAADFLGLSPAELRAQLRGTSLAALAQKQGKSVDDLKAAMLAPAKDRLAKAVAAGHITQARANLALDRLGKLVDRLVAKTFPTS